MLGGIISKRGRQSGQRFKTRSGAIESSSPAKPIYAKTSKNKVMTGARATGCALSAVLAAGSVYADVPRDGAQSSDPKDASPRSDTLRDAGSAPQSLPPSSANLKSVFSSTSRHVQTHLEPHDILGRNPSSLVRAEGVQQFLTTEYPAPEVVERPIPGQTVRVAGYDAIAEFDRAEGLRPSEELPVRKQDFNEALWGRDDSWNQGFSARVNVSAVAEESSFTFEGTKTTSRSSLLILEPYLRLGFLGNVTVEGRFIQRDTRDEEDNAGFATVKSDNRLYRDYSRIVADFPDLPARLEIGDLQTRGLQLQRSTNLLGVSVSSANADLQPMRTSYSRGARSFTLSRDSLVEVLVNGQREAQLFLKAGDYDLTDIPLRSGSNDLQLLIRDNTGQRQTLELSLFGAPQLLDRGEFVYSLSGGVQAIRTADGLDYFHDRYLIAGSAGFGINSNTQVNGSVVSVNANHAVTMGAVFSEWLGEVGGELFGQTGKSVKDAMAIKTYYRSLPARGGPEFRAAAVYFGPGYDSSEAISEFTRPLSAALAQRFSNERQWEAEASVSFELANDFVFDLGIDAVKYRHSAFNNYNKPEWSAYSSLLGPVGDSGLLSLTLRVGQFDDGPLDAGAFLSFTHKFGGNRSARVSHNTYNSRTQASLKRFSRRFTNDWSGGIGVERYTEYGRPQTNIVADFEFETDRGTLYAETTVPSFVTTDIVKQRYSVVELNTSVGYAGGAFALGRPSNGPFAVIGGDASLRDMRVVADFDGEEYSAGASGEGTLLYGDLLPYRDEAIELAAIDADGNQICAAEIEFLPANKSGKRIILSRDPATAKSVSKEAIVAHCAKLDRAFQAGVDVTRQPDQATSAGAIAVRKEEEP